MRTQVFGGGLSVWPRHARDCPCANTRTPHAKPPPQHTRTHTHTHTPLYPLFLYPQALSWVVREALTPLNYVLAAEAVVWFVERAATEHPATKASGAVCGHGAGDRRTAVGHGAIEARQRRAHEPAAACCLHAPYPRPL